MTSKTTAIPSRADAITDAMVRLFSTKMSSGQLRQIKPDIRAAIVKAVDDVDTAGPLYTLQPLAEWHEDSGPVLWWILPINEPPYCGTPLDSDWPGGHTHWTPLPDCRAFVTSDGVEIQ